MYNIVKFDFSLEIGRKLMLTHILYIQRLILLLLKWNYGIPEFLIKNFSYKTYSQKFPENIQGTRSPSSFVILKKVFHKGTLFYVLFLIVSMIVC